jgi:hypothetical protein
MDVKLWAQGRSFQVRALTLWVQDHSFYIGRSIHALVPMHLHPGEKMCSQVPWSLAAGECIHTPGASYSSKCRHTHFGPRTAPSRWEHTHLPGESIHTLGTGPLVLGRSICALVPKLPSRWEYIHSRLHSLLQVTTSHPCPRAAASRWVHTYLTGESIRYTLWALVSLSRWERITLWSQDHFLEVSVTLIPGKVIHVCRQGYSFQIWAYALGPSAAPFR